LDPLDRFGRARSELVATVLGISPDRVQHSVCGEWDIKCVLAHIIGWDITFAEMLKMLKSAQDVPYRGDDIQGWNEAFVRQREDKSWTEVLDEFVQAGALFVEEYGNLENDLWDRRFWEGKDATPAWVLRHNTKHYEEHWQEIVHQLRERDP
jgi:uncharacterized protein (TIGR03083 family)